MANLTDILNRPATDFNFPPPAPEGGYHCVVAGLPEEVESSEKKTPGYKFTLNMIGAMDDVDDDELKEFGGFEGKSLKVTFWISQDPDKEEVTVAMLREFLEKCGIEADGKSVMGMIEEAPNTEVIAFVKHKPQQGRDGFRAEVVKYARVQAD
jgi:hypothetical protein